MDARHSPATQAIDIGEVPLGADTEPGQPPGAGDRPPLSRQLAAWAHQRDIRKAVIALAATATLLLAGSASTAGTPALTRHFQITGTEDYTVGDTRLYALVTEGSGADRSYSVVAHRLADGADVWRVSAPDDATRVLLRDDGILTVHTPNTASEVALDVRTGVQVSIPEPPTSNIIPPRYREISGDAMHRTWGDYRAVHGDGLLTLHDRDTGAEVGRMTTDTEDWTYAADVAVATTDASTSDERTVTAYRLPEFTPLWEDARPVLADFHGCGDLLCLSANGAVTTFDPTTGEQEWRADWLPDGDTYDVESILPYEDYWRISADSRVDADHGRDGWLVARDTGQPVLYLDGWGQGAWYPVPDAGVLTWGFDEHQRQWLGRVRPDLSAVDPLGMVGDPASCELDMRSYPYLACRTGEDYPWTVQVWRVAG